MRVQWRSALARRTSAHSPLAASTEPFGACHASNRNTANNAALPIQHRAIVHYRRTDARCLFVLFASFLWSLKIIVTLYMPTTRRNTVKSKRYRPNGSIGILSFEADEPWQEKELVLAHLLEQASRFARTIYRIHTTTVLGVLTGILALVYGKPNAGQERRISLGRRAGRRRGPYRARSRQRLRG